MMIKIIIIMDNKEINVNLDEIPPPPPILNNNNDCMMNNNI